MSTQQKDHTNQGGASENFGIVDEKGREIGASVHTFEVDFVEVPAGTWGAYNTTAGHYFGFFPRALRAGKGFGAIKPNQLFATASERDAAVAKYLAGARKRASKIVK